MGKTVTVINEGKSAWILSEKAALLLGFAPALRDKMMQLAMVHACQMWLSVFYPLRFTKYDYSLGSGYQESAKYRQAKVKAYGDDVPLYSPPGRTKLNIQHMLDLADKATASAVVANGEPIAQIRIPVSHPLNVMVLAVIKTIPPKEVKAMAKDFDTSLGLLINGGSLIAVSRELPERPSTVAADRAPKTSPRVYPHGRRPHRRTRA